MCRNVRRSSLKFSLKFSAQPLELRASCFDLDPAIEPEVNSAGERLSACVKEILENVPKLIEQEARAAHERRDSDHVRNELCFVRGQ